MNTGQTMLVIAAFTLLSALTLAVNSTMITTSTMGYEIQANLNALSIAQSMLDEVATRAFDERTVSGRIYTYVGMTAATLFGADGAVEAISGVDSVRSGMFASKTRFDDVDDYHLYQRRAYDDRMGWYNVIDSVVYVDELDPATVSVTQTWHKQITVMITHPYMSKTFDGRIIPFYLRDITVYRQYF